MPWKVSGTFQRVNPDFTTGVNIWQQDQAASIKIIASRHDVHDQDIADGIAASLNLNGYNTMLAALKMGDFKITSIGDGTVATDAAAYGQIAGSMTFDNLTRILTLINTASDNIDTVNIPASGSGGDGTVTQINLGNAMDVTDNPITTTGTVNLREIFTPEAFTGGITAITVDLYGRVTSVTEGITATNLTNTPAATTLTVNSSTGNNTILPAAVSEGNAGVMTGAMAKQLADLVAAGVTGMIPPIEIVGVNETPQAALVGSVEDWTDLDSGNITNTGYTEIIGYTGSGVIGYLAACQGSLTGSASITLRLKIDTVIVWSATAIFVDGVSANDSGISLVGFVDAAGIVPTVIENVTFNTSWSLEGTSNQVAFSVIEGYAKYQKMT